MSFVLFTNFLFLISDLAMAVFMCSYIFSVYSISFSAIDRVWLNLYERALSGNEQLPVIKTFLREFIQCGPFFVFYTESAMLGPRFIPESVFHTQSVMLSPRFIPSPCFIPSP